MASEVTLYDVVRALDERAVRRMTPASSRVELAAQLGVDRAVVDPLVDEARERGYIEEHPRYRENWQVSDSGRAYLDAPLFDR
jgi:DNA-binding transcriptional MocR family regulator